MKIWESVYYSCCRACYLVSKFPREVRWFIQRGKRGYADIDCWDIDYYLVDIVPKMIKQFRKHYSGVPTCMYGEDDWDENWQITGEGVEDRAREKWNKILDEVLASFSLMKKELDWKMLTMEEIKIRNRGVKQLYKYFYHLWY